MMLIRSQSISYFKFIVLW